MTVKDFECHLNVMAVLPFSSGSRKNIYIYISYYTYLGKEIVDLIRFLA